MGLRLGFLGRLVANGLRVGCFTMILHEVSHVQETVFSPMRGRYHLHLSSPTGDLGIEVSSIPCDCMTQLRRYPGVP